ncbi:MAG: bifunctional folylpolyglutamate synthase/dihydrofolate synthase [Planctomycetes bacterium]|nr:bifunctional folylpolyglutamate synthase/dihydrofolate synthase [Planctomycetota bacterium]
MPFRAMDDFWSYVARFTNYEKKTDYAVDRRTFSLDRMSSLLERMGRPHERLVSLHVAGTNGKGTTSSLAAAILGEAGKSVGLYLSPHLVDVRERIQVNGRPVTETEWLAGMEAIAPHLEADHPDGRPTFFETLTALAFEIFVRREVDLAVLEVGLGGRLDATNVVLPAGAAVTEISLDHVQQLGGTVEEIAGEKAAILKPGVPAVSGVSDPAAASVIAARAREVGAPLRSLGSDLVVEPFEIVPREGTRFHVRSWIRGYSVLFLPMPGLHFLRDAALALGLCEILKEKGLADFSSAHLRPALALARVPGRCQLAESRPAVLLDGAHNPGAAKALAAALDSHFAGLAPVLLVASLADKDPAGFLPAFPGARRIYATRAASPRSRSAGELAGIARSVSQAPVEWHDDALALFDRARAALAPDEILVVTGSFYLVGEILSARYNS